jgi:transposase
LGGPATLHPRHLDLAQHCGFTIRACAPRQPQQKGRVESAVAYVK